MQVHPKYKALTRGIHDDCAYKQKLYESTSPLLYQLNPVAYESCNKCHMGYPGFIGKLGGDGFGIGPDRIDIDSDLRGQTRLLSKCPTHKYNPHAYSYCNRCEKCNLGLPCGCDHCRTRDVSHLNDCRPGIIPIESLDTRSFNACSDLNGVFINRFDYLCHNPQDPTRIFMYPDNRRLGEETRLDMKDFNRGCNYYHNPAVLPETKPCFAGGNTFYGGPTANSSLGCRYREDMNKNIFM